MPYEIQECPYCDFGKIHIEGSLFYTCPDCNGTCEIKVCNECGKHIPHNMEYCTDCYKKCCECGEIVPIDEVFYDEDFNSYCDDCYPESIKQGA